MDTSLRKFIVACVFIAISLTASAKDHNCDLTFEDGTPLTDADWDGTSIQLYNIMGALDDATPPNTDFYNFGANNIVSATVSTHLTLDPNYEYFFANVKDNKMTLSTSTNFAHLEEELERQTRGLYVHFKCDRGEATLVMRVNIKDTNNHDPTFDKPAGYKFNMLPMPLPSNFYISPIFEQIIVTDLDVTSKGLQLSLDAVGAEYFRVSSTAAVDKKKFQVLLTTTKKLQLTEQLDFMLSVSDLGTKDDPTTRDGIPVKVTIIPNVEEPVYEPKFEKSLYTSTITDATGAIIFNGTDIILNNARNDDIEFSLKDVLGDYNYSSSIECYRENSTDKVSCLWINGIDNTELLSKAFAVIILTAHGGKNSTARTVIRLTLPETTPPAPTSNCVLRYETVSNEIIDFDWNSTIRLNDSIGPLDDNMPAGKIFFTFNTENVFSATVSGNKGYFHAALRDQSLALFTSNSFPQIDKELQSQGTNCTSSLIKLKHCLNCSWTSRAYIIICFEIHFGCGQGERTAVLELVVKDTNNHPPEFDTPDGYVFSKLPMPLPDKLDLTPLFQQIQVTDIDVTSKGMYITLDEQGSKYFNVSMSPIGDSKKKFQVMLKTVQLLQLKEPHHFNILVNDLGTADDSVELMNEVTVTIEPDDFEWMCETTDGGLQRHAELEPVLLAP